MLPGELRWILRILWWPIVGNEPTGAKKLFLAVVVPKESNEILPKPRTFEHLVAAIAAILLFWYNLLKICGLGMLVVFIRELPLVYEKVTNQSCWTIAYYSPERNAWELLFKMAALGFAVRRLTSRGIFQTSRAFSLGSKSRASVAVVSIMID